MQKLIQEENIEEYQDKSIKEISDSLAELLDKKAKFIENDKEIQSSVSLDEINDPEVVKYFVLV